MQCIKAILNRALKSPGWNLLFVSLGIMAFSYLGARFLNYLNAFFPPKGVRNMFDGAFDAYIFLCVFFYFSWFLAVYDFLCLDFSRGNYVLLSSNARKEQTGFWQAEVIGVGGLGKGL